MDQVGAFVEQAINAVFAEAFAGFFLAGAFAALIGGALLALFVVTRVLGYRTSGVVVGAVRKKRKKQRQDGRGESVTKTSLYPVYEYVASNGETRRMQGSEGGSMTLGYATGQVVELIVREDEGYDDVYDVGQRGALYFGMGFLAVGVGVMVWSGSLASAFGASLLLGVAALLLRGLAGLLVRRKDEGVTNRAPKRPYSKAFDPADLHPVEHFQS